MFTSGYINTARVLYFLIVHVVRRDRVDGVQNADHAARTCEGFDYPLVKIGRIAGLLKLGLVWNIFQMKCTLLNERLCDISLVQLRDQICSVYQTVNGVSGCYYFLETKKLLRFSNNI